MLRDSTYRYSQVDKVIIAQESVARFVNDICPGAYTSMRKVSTSRSKSGQQAHWSRHRSTLTHWTAAISNLSVSTGAFLQSLISYGRLSVLMRKRNVILFSSVPCLNHPSVPFSSLLLALWVRRSNQPFAQDYTSFARQTSSPMSSTSFSGPKKPPGTTTHLGWLLGTVRHLCGT